jgi:hypothetical protein
LSQGTARKIAKAWHPLRLLDQVVGVPGLVAEQMPQVECPGEIVVGAVGLGSADDVEGCHAVFIH